MQNNIELLQKKMIALGLTKASLNLLWSNGEQFKLVKGKQIIKAGCLEHYLYFILKGIARVYITCAEKEVTVCFCSETDVLLSYNSFFNQTAGYENIILLEDSELLKISHEAVKQLCERDIEIANFFNKIIGAELVKTEERLIDSQSKRATERYSELIKKNPMLIQRVQLGYIASYLGVSQVTLSRIRAKLF